MAGLKLKPADYRVDEFDSGVEGVEPINREGTEVPKDKRKQVEDAAERAGIQLVEVKS